MEVGTFTAVLFLDDDGTMKADLSLTGDMGKVQVLGLLELARDAILHGRVKADE